MNNSAFDRSFDRLDELVDLISDRLGCPITIEDEHHRLLAHSSHGPQTDPIRIATIIGRKVPDQAIHALWRTGVIQKLMDGDEPVLVSTMNDIGLNERLAIAIKHQRNILGYIWALVDGLPPGGIDEGKRILIEAARAAKTKLLPMQFRSRQDEQGHKDFFWQLISGYYASDADVRDRARRIGVPLPAAYRMIVLEFERGISAEVGQRIRYSLMYAPEAHPTLQVWDDRQYIFLATAERAQDAARSKELFLLLKQRLALPSDAVAFIPGAGLPYEDYTLAERSYREALDVVRIRKQFPRTADEMYAYQDLGFYRFLPAVREEMRRHPFLHEGLRRLRLYDQEHQSELLPTLERYLEHDCNVKETAEALHIHANTLSYRLKRIEEIGELSLHRMDRRMSLVLEMMALKLER